MSAAAAAAAARMPSPRASPALCPQQSRSPRFDAAPRFEPRSPPSPRRASGMAASSTLQRRTNSPSLRLPSLPRFHPANYPNAHSPNSNFTTPEAVDSARSSPRAIQRLGYSDTAYRQQHLMNYYQQYELACSAAMLRPSSPAVAGRGPAGPHLVPIGSPGPVTPLELEATDGGYLVAGAQHAAATENAAAPLAPANSGELVDHLIRQETRARTQHGRVPSRDSR